MELTNEPLNVVIELPDTFTGEHYATYWRTRIENPAAPIQRESGAPLVNPADLLLEKVRGVLSIAKVTVDGVPLQPTLGQPYKVLRWVVDAADEWITGESTVPKASSPPPSEPGETG